MEKTYHIEVDCANCANKMERLIQQTPGVEAAVVNFLAQKVKVTFLADADPVRVMKEALRSCKKVDRDLEIYL